jgi:hypothetical protein
VIDVATRIQVTIDCTDPEAQAKFWATALRYEPDPPPEGYGSWDAWLVDMEVPEEEWNDGASIGDPDGEGPRIYFQKVPEEKVAKNRLHLDLDVGVRGAPMEIRRERIDAEAERLIAAGATVAYRNQTAKHHSVTMQDPEGNEFCLH